ncbi:MAG: hemerythrin domain-containing protein [Kofleriaceae bacterium]|nr:hemerythrin domain-containing protein [Kofleriaceae bacterium]MCL4222951.1 hemerythrin domain-containing protein [Myxococcales bacterium]
MATDPDPETTVTGYLSADHDRLDALLEELTALVAAGDLAPAARLLVGFAAGLGRHIRLEDELLFPTFERVTGHDGPTAVMREEHRMIEEHLAGMEAALASRDPAAFTLERAALVAVLGDHNVKEEAIVYPLTDDHLPDGARARLVAELRAFR